MPVYDISHNPVPSIPDVINGLVDGGTSPGQISYVSYTEASYLLLNAVLGTVPQIPIDGLFNIVETHADWLTLMRWATRPWTDQDTISLTPLLQYVFTLFLEQTQQSTTAPPYAQSVPSGFQVNSQPTVLSYMVYIMRVTGKTVGLPNPVPVP